MQRTASVAASALLAPGLAGGCSSSSTLPVAGRNIQIELIYDQDTGSAIPKTDIAIVGDRIVRIGRSILRQK